MVFKPPHVNDQTPVAHTAAEQPNIDPLKLMADFKKTMQSPGSATADSLPKFTLAADTLSLSPAGVRSVAAGLNLFLPPGNSSFPDMDPVLQRIIMRRLRMTWDGN
jgi:hypothetical protein